MNGKSFAAGVTASGAGLMLAAAIAASLYPTVGALGALARLLDALSPFFLLFSAALAVLSFSLGARALGVAMISGTVSVAAWGLTTYWHQTVPVSGGVGEARILFFNAMEDNTASAEAIVSEVLAAEADIVVIAEASAIDSARERFDAAYSFVGDCPAEACEILVATNLPVRRFWRLQLNPAWPARYAVAEVDWPGGGTVFVSAVHLAKPWLSGISEPELARLAAQYGWFEGPVVAVGDFNMPPWSRPIRELLDTTGFRATRGQPASWPAGAGPLGLPIDQILTRGGMQITQLASFGRDLGSNHLGFVADLSMSGAP